MSRRRGLGLLVAGAVAAAIAWVALRPNRAQVEERLALEHREVVADGAHDSNTDLIEWRYARSRATRLDGPGLFSWQGRVYAVARRQAGRRGLFTRLGGVWSRKRTALWLVEPGRLVWLSDLPSSGDTSYAGVVLRDGALWISYYTSDVRRDWPWLLGMLLPSSIRMARVPLTGLDQVAAERSVEAG